MGCRVSKGRKDPLDDPGFIPTRLESTRHTLKQPILEASLLWAKAIPGDWGGVCVLINLPGLTLLFPPPSWVVEGF